jgi:general secretion pathway protein G
VICGKSLFAVGERIAPRREEETGLAEAAAALGRYEPDPGPLAEVHDLLSVDKRLTSLLAFVPLWGLWRLSRSSQHAPQEKLLLVIASLGVTAILILGAWAVLPGVAEHARETRDRIGSQIQALAGLVREYYREHAILPDDSVWHRSAANGDLRFYDPWGRIYRYEWGPGEFTIGTYGRDGAPGGEGEDTDLFSEFPMPTTNEDAEHAIDIPPPRASPLSAPVAPSRGSR